jgi:hypothetical protein
VSLKHIAPITLFSPYFIQSCMKLFKHDTYLYYLPSVSTLLPLDDGLDMGRNG